MKKLMISTCFLTVIQLVTLSQTCLPGMTEFSSQASVDSFQIMYPNCTQIEGDIIIYGDEITNLNGLNVLTSIWGTLHFWDNESLTNLSGLENLESIGGDLYIMGSILVSLGGLDKLNSIGGDFRIYNNTSLSSLAGLESLTNIGGDVLIGDHLLDVGNPSLIDLTGFENVSYIGGDLNIMHNDALFNLSGCEGLTNIAGNLWIDNNPMLTTVIGLNNITSIGGELSLSGNLSLDTISGLLGLNYIGNGVSISGNPNLLKLFGLYNLHSIGGGTILIEDNDMLVSLYGLDNIDEGSIGHLNIFDNYLLSDCDVKSICDYLALPDAHVVIHDNDSGCDSVQEVEYECGVGINEKGTKIIFSIFPNPVNDHFQISSNDNTLVNKVLIYNQLGQIVLTSKIVTKHINVSALTQGLYIVEILSDDQTDRVKLIIE